MVNVIYLLGRIAHDLEYTVDDNDLARCTFKLAVERFKDNVDYPSITVFGDNAKNLVAYNNKGDLLHVTGYINTNRRAKEDGSYKYYENIIADKIKYLTPKTEDKEKEIENIKSNSQQKQKIESNEENNVKQTNKKKEKAKGFDDVPLPFDS